MKPEKFQNPFLPRASSSPEALPEKSGMIHFEETPQKLQSSEAYVTPEEANDFITKRTQYLKSRLQDIPHEDREELEQEMNALLNFKQKVQHEIAEDGENVLIENPYFDGSIEIGFTHLTKDEASEMLKQAIQSKNEALEARSAIMNQIQQIDEKSTDANEYLQHVQELRTLATGEKLQNELAWAKNAVLDEDEKARKQKSEMGISEKLREVLDEVDDAEERVAKYEKIYSLVSLREELSHRREAILKELDQITRMYESTKKKAAELHHASALKEEQINLRRLRAGIMESDLQRKTRIPSEDEVERMLQESYEDAVQRDQDIERLGHHAYLSSKVADYSEKKALDSMNDRHLKIAAEDRRWAMKDQDILKGIEPAFQEREKERRARLSRRSDEDILNAQKHFETEREDIAWLENFKYLDARGAELAAEESQRQEKKAQELTKSLDGISKQLKNVDERLEAVGPIFEQSNPSIEPHEKKKEKRTSQRNKRRAS
ncbi:hypothetical protein IT408_00175 [Candidatus Uhrbacteria bacterium]|nr:hypothetical protein [Candidatus Uhrbacteria bacterium]